MSGHLSCLYHYQMSYVWPVAISCFKPIWEKKYSRQWLYGYLTPRKDLESHKLIKLMRTEVLQRQKCSKKVLPSFIYKTSSNIQASYQCGKCTGANQIFQGRYASQTCMRCCKSKRKLRKLVSFFPPKHKIVTIYYLLQFTTNI